MCFFGKHLFISLFRAVQAIGIAAIPVVSATIIGDLFEGKERGEAMSLYQMLLALAPAIGPLIGGYLGSINGHLSVFLFLSILGILFINDKPFTTSRNKTYCNEATASKKNYWFILKNKTGFSITLIGFIQFCIYFCFLVFTEYFNKFISFNCKGNWSYVCTNVSFYHAGKFCYKFLQNASQQSKLYLLRVSSILYVSFYSLSHIALISHSSLSLHLCTVLVWDFLCQLTLLC